jgi:glycosyltransferase involved in cell wall biosynthesis
VTIRVLEVLGQSAGGVGRHVAEITSALDGETGLVVDIAAPADLRVPMPKEFVPVPIPSGVKGHVGATLRLRSVVRDGGYEVLHAHGLRAALDAGVVGRMLRVPVLTTMHNLIRPEYSGRAKTRVFAWLEPVAVRLSARTFVPSHDIARHLRAAVPRRAGDIEVLHAGTAPAPEPARPRDAVRRELGVEEDQSLIVTVARLHPQKDLPGMLEAVSGIDGAVLAVVGEGPLESELEDLAGELGIASRVAFVGFVDNPADYIAAADVFCLSSVWEAVALAAQEAVMLGIPVVTTDVGGMSELVTDGESGRLVAPGDVAALRDALDEVLAHPELGRKYAHRAREDYGANFSRDAVLARLREVYSEHANS